MYFDDLIYIHETAESGVIPRTFIGNSKTNLMLSHEDNILPKDIYDIYKRIIELEDYDMPYKLSDFKVESLCDEYKKTFVISLPIVENPVYFCEKLFLFSYQLSEDFSLRYYYKYFFDEGEWFIKRVTANDVVEPGIKIRGKDDVALLFVVLQEVEKTFCNDVQVLLKRLKNNLEGKLPKEFQKFAEFIIEDMAKKNADESTIRGFKYFVDLGEGDK